MLYSVCVYNVPMMITYFHVWFKLILSVSVNDIYNNYINVRSKADK